jgi:hypothetical protein
MGGVRQDVGEVITSKTRFHASRKEADRQRRLTAKHAVHVGEVLLAYNQAQASMFLLFWGIAADSDYDVSIGLMARHPER